MSHHQPSDRDLLREVYRHLDKASLLGKHRGMSEDDLRAFFRKLDRALPPDPPAPPKSVAAGTLVLYTDGGSRGNPGTAGYGYVLGEAGGKVIAERGGFLGRATNNEAEYAGLIAGLEAALAHGAKEILIRADSELLVRQLKGEYKVKSRNLMPLFLDARRLLDRFAGWRAEHIPRERNARADELANEAMDRGAESR